MLIRARSLLSLLVVCGALGCGACPPIVSGAAALSTDTTAAEPAVDTSIYWANVALVRERYCWPIATLSTRVLDACSCPAEERESRLLTPDELAASCSYHLVAQIPDDRPIRVNEAALAACVAALDASLVGCVEARLPPACELARLFDPAPGVLTYSRPVGSDCRAENGDESFDAHFLCAEGLTCAGTCTSEPSIDASYRSGPCRSPLWLPPAIP